MMMLLFKVDSARYGLNVADVVELVPYVSVQSLPKAPDYIPGLMNYRGNIVPVIDVAMLIGESPVKRLMSSRIILIKPVKTENRYIGLLAENVTETIKVSEDSFTHTGIDPHASAFVEHVVMHPDGLIQFVDVNKLMPAEIRAMVQNQITETAAGVGSSDVI